MRKSYAKYLLAPGIIMLMAAPGAIAQKPRARGSDTTIKSTTLDVYQVYKPELKPYIRHELQPSLPPQPAQQPEQTYTVPQQTLNYSYRSLPLRPLALGRDTTPAPKQNFIKLGGGNLNTFTGEAGIGSLHGHNWQGAVLAHFLRQEGHINGQKFTHAGIAADGSFTAAGQIFDVLLEGDYRRYGQYGFEQYTGVQPTFSYGRAGIGLRKTAVGFYGIEAAPLISLSLMTASAIDAERGVAIDLPFSKEVDSALRFELGLTARFTQLSPGYSYPANNIFEIKPAAIINRGDFTARIGTDPASGRNGTAYLLPKLNARYKAEELHIAFSAGWDAVINQNSYREQSLKNPFLLTPTDAIQTRQDEVYIGVEGGIGHHLTFEGRGSWWKWDHLPLFLNAWNIDAGKSFEVLNDPRVTAYSLQAGAKYAFAENFSIDASGTWYAYDHKSFDRVWGEPSVKFRADLTWRPATGLNISAYTAVLDGIYAQAWNGDAVKLKAVLDIGGGAEYQLVRQLSLFAHIANLLNNRNERWMGYQSFGLNVWGGLRYRF